MDESKTKNAFSAQIQENDIPRRPVLAEKLKGILVLNIFSSYSVPALRENAIKCKMLRDPLIASALSFETKNSQSEQIFERAQYFPLHEIRLNRKEFTFIPSETNSTSHI